MIAVMAQKSPKWQTLQKAAEEWSGAENGEWSTEAEEKFANGFLKYLHEGSAPTPKLKTVFEKIKQWFSETINRIRDFAGLTLDKDIISVYDALLGKPVKEIAQQSQQEKAEKTLEKLIEKNLVSAGHGDIWLGEDADIGAISQVAPDTFVRVKDTNGYSASFTVS